MSRPEQLLEAKLLAMSAVTDLVSVRIWPLYRLSNTLPAITYETAADGPINHSTGATKTSQLRIAVTCFASTYAGAKALADAVRGDEAESSPTGVSGWIDSNGSVWHLDDATDDIGEMQSGQDIPESWIVNLTFLVGYTKS